MPGTRPLQLATLAAITLAALLAGCATPIARSVVEANLAQEQAANQLLLLNIARAHERMPMHFSQIGQIRTAPGGWGLGVPGLGLELPFGGAAERKYTLSASNDGASPVDVSALTSQEFMRGITTPVTPETLGHFINQGWSKPLLMHVLFESVTWSDGKVLQNNPGASGYAEFRDFVEQASACELALDSTSSTSYLSSAQPAVSVRDGVRAATAKLDIVPVTRTGEVDERAPKNNDHFRLAAASKDAVLKLRPPPTGSDAQRIKDCSKSPALVRLVSRASKGAADGTSVVLRSPQAALFYLGQLSHAQNNGWYAEGAKTALPHQSHDKPLLDIRVAGGKRATLFDMSNRGDVSTPAVVVPYADQTFAVPRYAADPTKPQDRSVSVLALMQLILGLQDKGTEAPGASSVRLVR